MSISFQKLWENMSLLERHNDDASMAAIRNGIGIRANFWEDFLLLLNDSEGLSDLLGVPVDKIGTWHDAVKKNLNRVQESDGEVVTKEKNKLLKTGLSEEL